MTNGEGNPRQTNRGSIGESASGLVVTPLHPGFQNETNAVMTTEIEGIDERIDMMKRIPELVFWEILTHGKIKVPWVSILLLPRGTWTREADPMTEG